MGGQTIIIARDDAEFAFGFFVAKRRLDFSHLNLLKRLEPAFEARLSTTAASMGSKAVMLQKDRDVATLRIASFDGMGDQVDAAFAEIARSPPRALIIDLRDNTGGDYSSLRVATHLLERPADAGVVFRRHARRDVLAGRLHRFPRISNVATVEQLRRLMVEHGAVVGRVEPADQRYAGQVAVLINRRTASACEPLVALLQGVGRATLVGERTAGAMLSSEAFEVGQGWVLYLPVSDFLTADGRRLEGRGVPPDVKCNSSDAPLVARRLLEAAITSEVR